VKGQAKKKCPLRLKQHELITFVLSPYCLPPTSNHLVPSLTFLSSFLHLYICLNNYLQIYIYKEIGRWQVDGSIYSWLLDACPTYSAHAWWAFFFLTTCMMSLNDCMTLTHATCIQSSTFCHGSSEVSLTKLINIWLTIKFRKDFFGLHMSIIE